MVVCKFGGAIRGSGGPESGINSSGGINRDVGPESGNNNLYININGRKLGEL